MGYVNKVKIGNDAHLIEPTLYCECSTAAATAAKTATLNGFELQTGVQVTVKFTVTNTADNPTLSINGSTAKAIYYQGSAINKDFLIAGQTYNFIYNGEQWDLISDPTKFSIGDTLSITNGGTGATTAANARTNLGLGSFATKNSLAWDEITQSGADNLSYGTSDVTASTEILTSWATDNGFSENSHKGVVYRRAASKIVNSTLVKAALGTDSSTTDQWLNKSGTWSTPTATNIGLGNVENTALSTWAGTSNITTLGTITTGTWNGTTLDVQHGGTGKTSLTANAILLGNGTSAIKASSILIGTSSSTDYIVFKVPIYNSTTTGGWARTIVNTKDANDAIFFRAGYYGYNSSSASVLYYFYMGPNDYDSVSNFRIYPDGGIYTSEIKPYSITSLSNLNSKSGTYFFASSSTFVISDISANSNDWVGLQVGNVNDKWQLTASNNHLWLRQNDTGGTNTADWSSWYRLIDSSITISGDVSATLSGNTFTTSIGEGKVTNTMLANSSITIADNTLSLGDTLTATDLRTSLSLSAALRFIGVVASDSAYTPSDGGTGAPTITGITSYTPIVGDVILDSNSDAEYVCSSVSGTTYTWELLGRDGSWALSTHTHGNITNDGKLATANRMVWTDSSKNIYASSHYVDSTHVAINSTSQPSNAFYVNGSSYFADNISLGSEKKVIFKTNRKYEGTESIGWAFALLVALGKNDTTPFFNIGVYGSRNAFSYAYFGSANYDGNNLRVYSDGVVKIPVTTASTSKTTGALVVGGGIGVSGNVYATTFYGDLSGNATSSSALKNINTNTGSGNRPTSADLTHINNGGVQHFKVADETNSIVGNILHFHWDTSSAWDSQLLIPHSSSDSSMKYRASSAAGTWDSWRTLLDSSNYSTYAATSTHTHGNITNDGKLTNANRLCWTNSSSEIDASYHYANATKIAINSSSEPTENFYVSGKTQLNIGTSDSSSQKNFIVYGNNRFLSIGSQGIQSYSGATSSTTASILYLQYAGGGIEVGSTSTSTDARNMYGMFDFKSTNGFTYSGMGTGTYDITRPIWFMYAANASTLTNGRPAYSNNFKYNPATNTITIGTGTLSATSYSGNAASASAISATLATTTKTYLLGTSTAITATAANVNLTGDTGVYLTTTAGELSALKYSVNDGTNEKVRLEYNSTDQSLDFIFI